MKGGRVYIDGEDSFYGWKNHIWFNRQGNTNRQKVHRIKRFGRKQVRRKSKRFLELEKLEGGING